MHLQILFINNGYVWSCHILNKVILRVKGSDRESDYDKLANIPAEESDYSSSSEDEGDSDSHEDQNVDMVTDFDTESSDEEGEVGGSSKTGKTSQNFRWCRRQPVVYDVVFRGEPFPPPPLR